MCWRIGNERVACAMICKNMVYTIKEKQLNLAIHIVYCYHICGKELK